MWATVRVHGMGEWLEVSVFPGFYLELDCIVYSCFQKPSHTGVHHLCVPQPGFSFLLAALILLFPPFSPLSLSVSPTPTLNPCQALSITHIGREVGVGGEEGLKILLITQEPSSLKLSRGWSRIKYAVRLFRCGMNGECPRRMPTECT